MIYDILFWKRLWQFLKSHIYVYLTSQPFAPRYLAERSESTRPQRHLDMNVLSSIVSNSWYTEATEMFTDRCVGKETVRIHTTHKKPELLVCALMQMNLKRILKSGRSQLKRTPTALFFLYETLGATDRSIRREKDWCCSGEGGRPRGGEEGLYKSTNKFEGDGFGHCFHCGDGFTHQIVHVNYVQFTVCRKVAKENRGRKIDGPRKQPHPSVLLGIKFNVNTLYRRPFQSNLHNAEIPPRDGKI